ATPKPARAAALGPLAGGRGYSHRSSRPRERLPPVSRRGELADHRRAKLSIERGDGEERLVTLDGVVVGRLHPDGEERWRLVWRGGWGGDPHHPNHDGGGAVQDPGRRGNEA